MTGFKRTLLALTLLIPIAVVDLKVGQPIAISAIASTAAIVLHAPRRYQRRPRVIPGCYLVALGVAVPLTVAGVWLGWPGLITAAVAAAVIAATPAARAHPPVACIPFAVLATADPAAMVIRWAVFVAAATYGLSVLRLLTLGERRADDVVTAAVAEPDDRGEARRRFASGS